MKILVLLDNPLALRVIGDGSELMTLNTLSMTSALHCHQLLMDIDGNRSTSSARELGLITLQ
jgi:hypothetical protein